MSFLAELKRRNVLRVGAAYIVTAWLIVQVVETLFPVYGLSDEAIRMVVNVLAIGLIPVLVLSWVFEWTPQGLKRDAEVDHGTEPSVDAARRLDRVILIVLALALGYFAFDKFILDPQREAEQVVRQQAELQKAREEGRSEAFLESFEQSIAVLAFDDMSQQGDQEYLSDGIAEEILHLLEKIDGLRVISRTSAFSYKGKDVPITTIAEQLDVAHILEGSVRKAGNRIRVTAQLIDARTDTHLWSETYDRTLDDIFAIQDELAAAMVDQLQIELLGEAPRSRRVDPEAYLLWLEGHRLVAYVDSDKAALLLEQAVEIDPDFFDAWLDLSRAYYQMSTTFLNKDHEGDENWYKGEQAWTKVRELDPENPAVLAWEAWTYVVEDLDYERAAREVEKAVELAPGDWEVVRMVTIVSNWLRRPEIAVRFLGPIVRKDPLCTDCSYRYARALLNAGLFEEAEQEIMRFRRLVPGVGGELTLGKARLLNGDIEGARQAFNDFPEPENPGEAREAEARIVYGNLLLRLQQGDMDNVEDDIRKMLRFESEGVQSALDVAEIYATAGDNDRAFEWLNRFKESRVPFAVASQTTSLFFRNLHSDPRWEALLTEAGVASHQIEAINFNPKLPEE